MATGQTAWRRRSNKRAHSFPLCSSLINIDSTALSVVFFFAQPIALRHGGRAAPWLARFPRSRE